MRISNKAEFDALLEQIDQALKKDGVPIHARQIQGFMQVCQKLQLSLPMVGEPIHGIYQGSSLAGHIRDWFVTRYGDRLKFDFSPGCFPIAIHEDLYLARLPFVLGSAKFFISRAPRPSDQQLNRISRDPVPFNFLDLVVDLTDGARQSLTDEELRSLSQLFLIALQQSSDWQIASREFQDAISDDLELSATLAVDGKFGLSRWHSLQAAEKAIKAFIKQRGGLAPHIHNLRNLHDQAMQMGMPSLIVNDLTNAQCAADVRYEKKNSTQSQTLAANEAARRICTAIAQQISSLASRPAS
ncbi:HEPN domain-containing protein [Bradyrhizobium sp. G127]|uniref:HEPN domain-containing protein n=1 Tax=Bradyrhizobium sp. G127 TaxID=2904800 RepID=UPI001F2FF91A|nr:HEPN domain-containing protein [Bradyrhizobium sp. G127]MCF2522545.1 HEPN domain-containing protein [Bradyrhizobium sp. G127]